MLSHERALASRARKGSLTLKEAARRRGLRFGSSIKWNQVDDRGLARLFTEQCDVVVSENAFKWKVIERKPGQLRWDRPDAVATFAGKNGLSLRGHTMIWNQDDRVPAWLTEAEPFLGDQKRSQMANVMIDHVFRLAARYPEVTSWDAVNEAIKLNTGEIRDSVFTRTIGDDFADIALRAAREAAPDAQLVYNDYMLWHADRTTHRDGVLRFLEGLLSRDVPLDALGIQSHLAGTYGNVDERAWRAFLAEVEGMGLKVLVTELDCGDRDVPAAEVATRDAETAAHVKRYLDLTLSFENVEDVVLWGLTDRDSYVNGDFYPEARRRADGLAQRAHPYDEDLAPKPMRDAILAALKAAPER